MKTIWKFKLPFEKEFKILMPTKSKILCIQRDEKDNCPCLWALVNPENQKEPRYFKLFGTGHTIEDEEDFELEYIGTYQYQKGEFVGHIFEVIVL